MRARNLKPGFFKNEQLAELPPLTRILFWDVDSALDDLQGLWCMADRRGRLEDRPKRIKAEVLPYDDDVQGEINQLARELHLLRLALARRQPTEHDRVTIRALESRLVKLYREKRAVLAGLSSLAPSDGEDLWPADERAIWTLARLVTPNGREKGQRDDDTDGHAYAAGRGPPCPARSPVTCHTPCRRGQE